MKSLNQVHNLLLFNFNIPISDIISLVKTQANDFYKIIAIVVNEKNDGDIQTDTEVSP